MLNLYGDQRLILEVEAVLGRGRDHAKWQAVQAPGYQDGYQQLSLIKIKLEDVKKIIKKLPEGIVEIKGDKIDFKR